MLSIFAPKAFPRLFPIQGVDIATMHAGIKRGKSDTNRPDLVFFSFPNGGRLACMVTMSSTPSAPVQWCLKHREQGHVKGLVINSGNANAFTGDQGNRTVKATATTAAKILNANPSQIFIASTGVIGEPLSSRKITMGLNSLSGVLKPSTPNLWEDAAEAIRTTDTYSKGSALSCATIDNSYHINGIAKGSGMIFPNMGTFIAVLVTDAPLSAPQLQESLRLAVDQSFHAISVDGDTSTSDSVFLISTAKESEKELSKSCLKNFQKCLNTVCKDLALQVVSDGEGIQHLLQIDVTGAESKDTAKSVAFSVANSPLVKSMVAGKDPNWGRIVMAVGKSGVPLDLNSLDIYFKNIQVTKNGKVHPDYLEEMGIKIFNSKKIPIRIHLGSGKHSFRAWTSDLTHEYIRINADYRS